MYNLRHPPRGIKKAHSNKPKSILLHLAFFEEAVFASDVVFMDFLTIR
jgi:hypothetical protein